MGGAGGVAEGAELLLDRVAGEVGVDLVEAFALQGKADLVDRGTGAGAGEGEGAFERAGRVHIPHMDWIALES